MIVLQYLKLHKYTPLNITPSVKQCCMFLHLLFHDVKCDTQFVTMINPMQQLKFKTLTGNTFKTIWHEATLATF